MINLNLGNPKVGFWKSQNNLLCSGKTSPSKKKMYLKQHFNLACKLREKRPNPSHLESLIFKWL